MKKVFLICISVVMSVFAFAKEPQAKPGSFDNSAPKEMSSVLALDSKLNIKDDEFVVYYVRKDKDYAKWALWMWANPGGDGTVIFPYSQNWSVKDGIGYMRFKMDGSSTGGNKFLSDNGGVGLIVREKEEWNKDGGEDRLWNVNVSNKVVIFSGDMNTYAAVEYKPSIKKAELTSLKQIDVKLSGRYALDIDGGFSGFSVVKADGTECKISKVVNADSPKDPYMNFTKNITVYLDQECSIGDALTLKNPNFLSGAKVSSTKLSIQIAEKRVPPANEALGCQFDGEKAVFKLWAPTSSSCKLRVYYPTDQNKEGVMPVDFGAMDFNPKTGVWSYTYSGNDINGHQYDYVLENSKGTVVVLDPYAKSMSPEGRACVVNMKDGKAGNQVESFVKLAKREDAVIYEVSVRDFTISPDAGVKSMPGTYKAFIEKIPYLKDLGVTHVQLMPVMNFFYNDECNKAYEASGTVNGNNYNWGYDPHNYFTPEGWYATDARDSYCRIKELRELIDECHKNGIGVLLDCVYNHMATTSFLDDIVPGYYFRMNEDGSLRANSGCGNDTATERMMMKKIVVDSTKFWVENYKVDGFRFDLMGLMEASSVLDAYKECAKINPSVLFEGEGWKMYSGPAGTFGMDQNYMMKTDKVAVFNDEFRDLVKAGGFNETGRGFITKKSASSDRIFRNFTGNPVVNYHVDQPGDNLNYIVCHDGLTLHDAIVNNLRLDESKDKKEIIRRIKLGNFCVLTSQGLAFLHAGQERGRTKPNVNGAKNESIGKFVRNSYDSSDNINQIVWTLDKDYENLLDYTKGLVQLRKTFDVFRMSDAKKIAKNFKNLELDDSEELADLNGLVFGYTIKDKKDTWVILINANLKSAEINTGVILDNGVILSDSECVDVNGIKEPKGVRIEGSKVILDALTATVIRLSK